MSESAICICILLPLFITFNITVQRVCSISAFKRFNRFELCDDYVNQLVDEIKRQLGIKKNILVAINEESRIINGDVSIYKDNVLIVMHGRLSYKNTRVIICHELAHVKLNHLKFHNKIIFVFCVFSVITILGELYVNLFINEMNRDFFETVILLIITIFLGLYSIVFKTLFKKVKWKQEYAADLLAANIVGVDLYIDTINSLKDVKKTNGTCDHPSKSDRAQYLINHYKSKN